jgi:C4-dicarboxylate-specific signal transduction histidine kinase
MYWLIAALVVAGWIAVFISSRSSLQRACAELRSEFQRQIDSLEAKIESLERTVRAPAAVPAVAASSIATQAQPSEKIAPETLATITETVAALLGRKVHVRSAKILPAPDAAANPWAQRGRAIVQASHDFSQRSRP